MSLRLRDRAHLVNHWTPLPGWTPERSLLACYVTLEDQPEAQAVIDAYQRRLADVPELDLIQRQWLHVTVQGIGFLDVLAPGSLPQLADSLQRRLARVPAPTVVIDPPEISQDAVHLPLAPADGLVRVRQAVRSAAADTLGLPEPYALPGQDGDYRPHVSIAYANGPAPCDRVRDRLDAVAHAPTTLRFGTLSVLALRRVDRTWQWSDEVRLGLGVRIGRQRARIG